MRLTHGRKSSPPTPVQRSAEDAWTVDWALRALAAACSHAGRPVPGVYTVVVGIEDLELGLATPDEQPPPGWTTDHDGRTWHTPLPLRLEAGAGRSPYPRLVSLGESEKGPVFLDLGQSDGVISLEGDATWARALADAWGRELATSPWSQDILVIGVGFEKGPASLAHAAPAFADERGGVLLLAGPPAGRDAESIRGLADAPASRWSVVTVGPVDDARWRFTVDSVGRIDTGILDRPVVRRTDSPSRTRIPPTGNKRTNNLARLPGPRWVLPAVLASVCVLAIALVVANQTARSKPAGSTANVSPPSASTAVTATPDGAGIISSVATGLCVDAAADPSEARPCDGSGTQRWTGRPTSPGAGDAAYRLVNQQTGLCLDPGNQGVHTEQCQDRDANQVWQRVQFQNTDVVAYRDGAAGVCLSVAKSDRVLRARQCPTDNSWSSDLLFRSTL